MGTNCTCMELQRCSVQVKFAFKICHCSLCKQAQGFCLSEQALTFFLPSLPCLFLRCVVVDLWSTVWPPCWWCVPFACFEQPSAEQHPPQSHGANWEHWWICSRWVGRREGIVGIVLQWGLLQEGTESMRHRVQL